MKNNNLFFNKFRANELVVEKRSGEILKVICPCQNYQHFPLLVLQTENATFKTYHIDLLDPAPAEAQFKCKKRIRNGCLVRIVNPHNNFDGKKVTVKKVEDDFISFMTHEGIEYIHLLCVKIL